jgi:predicted O-linked N-acetylglucosamine transferase (SPINDLY family)
LAQPVDTTTLFQLALSARSNGNATEAEALCKELLRVEPRHHDAWHLRGLIAVERGNLADAIDFMQRSVGLKPGQPAALSNLGNALLDSGRAAEALDCFDRALRLVPGQAEAVFNRGNALRQLGRRAEALAQYELALQFMPQHPLAQLNRAVVLSELGRMEDALAGFDAVVARFGDFPLAHEGRGSVLMALGRFAEALACFERALALGPGSAGAHGRRGNALLALGRHEEARKCFSVALGLDGSNVDALINRAKALKALARPDLALADLEQALRIQPTSTLAWNNLGSNLMALYRFEQALESFDRALQHSPGNLDAQSNRGLALLALQRNEEALGAFDAGLKAGASRVETIIGHAESLANLGRHRESAASMELALQLDPQCDYALGHVLAARLKDCDWQQHDALVDRVLAANAAGQRVMHPLPFLAVTASTTQQQRCAEAFAAATASVAEGGAPLAGYGHKRIRIAYVSPDFREHPVAYLMAGVFEQHDRSRFETIAVSLRADADSPMARRLKPAFSQFIDASRMSDRDVALMLRKLEADIVVDLMGYTDLPRSAIFAHRAAPVQVNYLGFPGTMGSAFMDYIIADRFVIPPASRRHYSERVVYLPDCFQANDDLAVRESGPTREELGLPTDAVVLCCFNNCMKINPPLFDIWCRVLQGVPRSVLWLVVPGIAAQENLRREATLRGVDPQRLVFASMVPYQRHLGRLPAADLFLDTLPFNAGATASDALRAGVPVVTCPGDAFAARMAGSLLQSLGMLELVAADLHDYERLVLQLARNREQLAAVRRRLEAATTSAPLFRAARFCRHLEDAYSMMWERAERGEPPTELAVEGRPTEFTKA